MTLYTTSIYSVFPLAVQFCAHIFEIYPRPWVKGVPEATNKCVREELRVFEKCNVTTVTAGSWDEASVKLAGGTGT